MEIVDFSTKKTSETKQSSPDEIADFLKGYAEPMKVPEKPDIQQPLQNSGTTGQPSWKGDPRYYQRGAKKGTLKPEPLRTAINPNAPASTQIGANAVISGSLLITLIDLLIPLAITALNNTFSDKKIKPEMLQMQKSQKDTLAPVCDQVAQHINLTGNPVIILIVSLIGIYGMNFLMIKQGIDANKK